MSDKKLNAIKEIEARISAVKGTCKVILGKDLLPQQVLDRIDFIDTLLFDINDFINDLKDDRV